MSQKRIKKICFFGAYVEGYPRSDVLRKGLEMQGVAVVSCRTSPRRRMPRRYFELVRRYLEMKRDFDVIYVPEFRHKDVPLAWLLARLSGKRIVFDPLVSRFDTKIMDRGDAKEGSFQAWHNRNLDRISLRLPDLIVADTDAHARYYRDSFRVADERIKVLPVGCDDEIFSTNGRRDNGGATGRAFNVLFFGNYLPLHGVDIIVAAAALLRDEKDIEFTIIGRGQTYDGVERMVRDGALDNVRLRDRVSMRELASFLSKADVSLGIFGRTEKTRRVVANKVYQSMAMGVPVITADTEAVREFFTDDENICLVPPADARALAEKIRYLRARDEVRRTIAEAGARLVHEKYTSRSIASQFLEYCGELS